MYWFFGTLLKALFSPILTIYNNWSIEKTGEVKQKLVDVEAENSSLHQANAAAADSALTVDELDKHIDKW